MTDIRHIIVSLLFFNCCGFFTIVSSKCNAIDKNGLELECRNVDWSNPPWRERTLYNRSIALTIVNCASNNGVSMAPPSDVFSDLDLVQKIAIHGCNLTAFHIHVFSDLSDLQEVDISSNIIPQLVSYGKSASVVKYNVSHSGIKEILSSFVDNLTQIGSLDLSYNEIPSKVLSTTKHVALSSLTTLRTLDLSYNNLGDGFSRGDFKELFSSMTLLETLGLAGLDIKELPKEQFMKNANLKRVNLAANKFTEIQQTSLLGPVTSSSQSDAAVASSLQQQQTGKSIERLDVSENMIIRLDSSLIHYLDNLTSLTSFNIFRSQGFVCDCAETVIFDDWRKSRTTGGSSSSGSNSSMISSTNRILNIINYRSYRCSNSFGGAVSLEEYAQCIRHHKSLSCSRAHDKCRGSQEHHPAFAVGILIIVLIILLVLVALAFYKFKLCSKYKTWRAQVRYKGVQERGLWIDDGAVEMNDMEQL